MPWSYKSNGKWKGFCIDLIRTLAKRMNFDYQLVLSKDADTMGLKTINEGILQDIFTEVSTRNYLPYLCNNKKYVKINRKLGINILRTLNLRRQWFEILKFFSSFF